MDIKICNRCKEVKNINDMYPKRAKCLECHQKETKEWYQNNKQKMKEKRDNKNTNRICKLETSIKQLEIKIEELQNLLNLINIAPIVLA